MPFDFDFSDELDTFGFPYVYFLHYNFLTIVSPITNQRVKNIDFGPSLMQKIEEHKLAQKVKKILGAKQYESTVFSLYTNISIAHYMEVYLSSPFLDCCLFLRLVDDGESDQQIKLKIADKQLELAAMWGPPR